MKKRTGAFTLIELLISIAIISFGITVLFGIVLGTLRSSETIQQSTERESTLLYIMHQLKRELESAYFCPQKCGVYLEEMGFFGRTYDRLIFTTMIAGFHEEVEYSFGIPKDVKDDTTHMVKRVDRKLDGDLLRGGYSLKILEGVREFDVKVFANGTWHERWNPNDGRIQFVQISGAIKYGNTERRFRMFVEPMAEDLFGVTGIHQRP